MQIVCMVCLVLRGFVLFSYIYVVFCNSATGCKHVY